MDGELVDLGEDVFAQFAGVAAKEEVVGPGQVDGEEAAGEGVVHIEDEAGLGPHGECGDEVGEYEYGDDGYAEGYHEGVAGGESERAVCGGEPAVGLYDGGVHDDVDEWEDGQDARGLGEGGEEPGKEDGQRVGPLAGSEDGVEFAECAWFAGAWFAGRCASVRCGGVAAAGSALVGGGVCRVPRKFLAHANTSFSVRLVAAG